MPTDEMSKGKKIRYEKWLAQVKSRLADKYGITLDQAIAIINTDGIGVIRCLLSWVESDEFIEHYVFKTKGYTNTGIDEEGHAIGNCKNCGSHGVLITKHKCETNKGV